MYCTGNYERGDLDGVFESEKYIKSFVLGQVLHVDAVVDVL